MKFEWPRFWIPRSTPVPLDGDAFLWDPTDEFGQHLSRGGHVRTLDKLDSSVAVLLGEPGIGKSYSVEAHAAVSTAVTVVPLPDQVSAERLRFAVDAALASDPGPIEVVFDGLDEAMIRWTSSDKWLPAALEHRPDADLVRLRVRVTCRPAVWPESLGYRLAKLWPDEETLVLSLAPLRRKDVISAATQLGVDGAAFLDALSAHDLLPFAARPVTLTALLRDFAEGKIPSGKVEVYVSMCRRLSEDLAVGHHEALLAAPPGGPGSFEVAGRIAALSEFAGRPILWRGADPLEREFDELALDDALRSDDIDRAVLQRAVNTGLFETAGADRFRFAHRTYGEFLAAYHAELSGLTSSDLLALIRVPGTATVQPQLTEVAAWLAALRPELFEVFVATEPELLLDSDVATRSETDRQRLATAVIARQDGDAPPHINMAALRRLASAGLVPVLSGYIAGTAHSWAARAAAVEMAAGIGEMVSTLAHLIADPDADIRLRERSARLLPDDISENIRQSLVEVALQPSITDQLRGTLLRFLWPATMTLDDALKCAGQSQGGPQRVVSAFSFFLTQMLPAEVSLAELPIALTWVAGKADRSGDFADASDALLLRAAPHLSVETIALPAARVYLLRHMSPGRRRGEVNTAIAAGIADVTARRQFIEALVAAGDGSPPYAIAAVGTSDDFAWALGRAQADATPIADRRRWVDAASRWFDPLAHPEHLEALCAAEDDPNVGLVFAVVLHGLRLDSPEADAARARHADERQWEQQELARSSQSELDQDAASAALRGNDADTWMVFMGHLDPHFVGGTSVRMESLDNWTRLTSADREAAVRAARRWLLERMPPAPLEAGHWPGEVLHALRALWLYADDADTLAELGTEQWAGWIRVVLGMALVDADEDLRRRDALLARAYREAPQATRDALVEELDVESARARVALDASPVDAETVVDPLRAMTPPLIHTRLEQIWDDELSAVFLDWQRNQTDDFGFADSVPFLIDHGCDDAAALAGAALEESGDDLASRRRRVAGAVALLRSPDSPTSWPAIWKRWQQDEAFAAAVLNQLDRSASWDLPPSLATLGDDVLADLYLWLHPRRPTDDAGWRTAKSSIADGILSHLQTVGTVRATQALAKIAAALPDDATMRSRLAEARRAFHLNSWVPPSPADIRVLLDDRHRRLVRSDQDLAAVVVESLGRAQDRIAGETPAVTDLWDHPHKPNLREPKVEPDLSDWLKRHVGDDLHHVIVNREVEITTGFLGVRKMREVDLHVAAFAPGDSAEASRHRVIVENKCCWNSNVMTDIKTQLVDTYLAQTGCCAGVYVVFYFDCEASKSNRPCALCRTRSIEQLRADLEQRARQLTTPDRAVVSIVIDARLAAPGTPSEPGDPEAS